MTVRIVVFDLMIRRANFDLNFVARIVGLFWTVGLFFGSTDQSFVETIFLDSLWQFFDVTSVFATRNLHYEIGLT